MALNQFSSATIEQLTLLIDMVKLGPSAHVLDAGCETGHITKYLAETTGTKFRGVDVLPQSGRCAPRLAEKLPGRLEFQVADMKTPSFAPGS